MKILITLTFITFSLMAQTIKPSKMYDHTNILTNYFRPLQQYTQKLKQLYPYDMNKNELNFYTESHLYSHFRIELEQIDKKNYELIFHSENFDLEIISFQFDQEISLTLDQILSLNFTKLLLSSEYRIKLESQNRMIQSDINENTRLTQYHLGPSGAVANLEEYSEITYYESTLFFSCNQCGGDILRAQFSPNYERYFRGFDQIEVNDTDFFNRANRFYIGAILRGIDQLISEKIDQDLWPDAG